jgi:hypothetical protein
MAPERPVDRAELESVLGRLFATDAVQVDQWSCEPIPYLQYRPGRSIQRLSGVATCAGQKTPWSLITKCFRDPGLGPRAAEATIGAERELHAYASGLLTDLPPGILAPRFLGTSRRSEDETSLWLEDVVDLHGGYWSLPRFGLAARHLGQFNGAYLVDRTLPADRWLSERWAEAHSDPPAALVACDRIAASWQRPEVRSSLPDSLADPVFRLLRDQAAFISALGHVPSTLCHHDAAQANLFARRGPDDCDETVAIDWEEIGPGAVGAEIATLVFGTLRRDDLAVEQADALDQVVFDGYLDGLHDAGWHGDPLVVRFGYAAAVALRWYLPAGLVRTVAEDALRSTVIENTSLTLDEFVRRRVALTEFLLARADEARGIANRLGLAHVSWAISSR